MKISEFLSENFHFLLGKFYVYLNRLVFVMQTHAKVNQLLIFEKLGFILMYVHSQVQAHISFFLSFFKQRNRYDLYYLHFHIGLLNTCIA